MDIGELKPGIIITSSMWPEPIHIKKIDFNDSYVHLIASTIFSNQHIDQMIPKNDIININTQTIKNDFSSDAWKIFLWLEAKRYKFASLYDPLLAMNTSKVDPLPHQIEAVYGYVLRMPKIRFLLAHDPGAGKTIMAGLIIKELKMRRLINRILIVVPGHLKDQWRRELKERFEETFVVVSKGYVESHYAENVWKKENQIITSIDFAKRDENIPSLNDSEFDMIIVDEAHKMSATKYGESVGKTSRYKLGEILSKNSEHLLFLTATPHKGDPENFRLFLDLLNPGFFKNSAMIQESLKNHDNPLFLRRIKEDMKDFEGKPLFVPRVVITPDIRLSDSEKMLYNEVSDYVHNQYNKAMQSDKKRNIGFALVILQRRIASSTYALLRSLERRKLRLEDMLKGTNEQKNKTETHVLDFDDLEDMSEKDRWREEELWETLSVAENKEELQKEIIMLAELIHKAKIIIDDEKETKLAELKNTLIDMDKKQPKTKILIFTESKDTLKYIEAKLKQWNYDVNIIHGGMQLEERINAESIFKNKTQILVATEAAGEGINLQFCHMMINYDLPWNPNRLEQRMGRIHRYGQQLEVSVFNLVASDTREGKLMIKLFEKLDEIKNVLKSDKVFDVISEILPGKSLSQLFIDAAINTRDQDEILKELEIDVNQEFIADIKDKLGDSLAVKYIDYTGIKEMKNKAMENKLIPKYTEELFKKAFLRIGGKMHHRSDGFIVIDSIPYEIRRIADRDMNKRSFGIMLKSYPKITFDKDLGFKNQDAEFVTFGHPLFESILIWIDETFNSDMQKGATFFDPRGSNGYIVFYEGEIRDGTNQIAGKKLFAHFTNTATNITKSISPTIIWDLIESNEHNENSNINVEEIKNNVLSHVMSSLENYRNDLQKERNHQSKIKQKYGVESLRQTIKDLDNNLIDLKNRRYDGEKVDIVIRNKEGKKRKCEENKLSLEKAIKNEQSLTMTTPSFLGIIRVKPLTTIDNQNMHNDPEVEKIGMNIAMQYEINNNRIPEDVSKNNLGFDVRSTDENKNVRHIEVKARAKVGTIVLTTNEWYQASQMGDSYYLYVIWNAKNNPNSIPIIIQNPVKNLTVEKKIVSYCISFGEIRDKAQ